MLTGQPYGIAARVQDVGLVVRLLCWCLAALALPACTTTVDGLARSPAGAELWAPPLIDAHAVLLDLNTMRAITGAGTDLSVIPSMDTAYPVDIEPLAEQTPPPCRFLFAETATFGTSIDDFHKISYQSPPDAGLISQAAAVYVDKPAARTVFDTLTRAATDCAQTRFGQTYLGEVSADGSALQTRSGECGRDYRLKAVVVAEVTFCAFGETVPEIVLANLLGGIPE
ncbi:sensor domain-containing protein [Mycolicibacterium chitae]|uniref:Protein LpqA n=1 Tax=Mycolicibacterium chitae TaxID=1792 RepID=A0A3S4REY2_MYCCI|nr:sensor domain-containing protein [Mycolicibacterium chitae]BBZ05185.1 sensor domain-containing protein [Mycolicibacterium chitae]VEG48804.1 protein LpqA [Mycolicibacterium chitae]